MKIFVTFGSFLNCPDSSENFCHNCPYFSLEKSKAEWAKKLKLTERLFQKMVWFLKYFARKEECISKIIASSRYEHGTVSCVDDKGIKRNEEDVNDNGSLGI